MIRSAPYTRFASTAEEEKERALEPIGTAERRRLSTDARAARLWDEMTYVGRLYVPTQNQIRCSHEVRRTRQRAFFNIHGAQTSLYVLGSPFMGKSTSINLAAQAIYREALASHTLRVQGQPRIEYQSGHAAFIPVIRVQIRPDAQNRAVVSHLVNFCGYGTQGTAHELTNSVAEYAQKHGVQLVILDEVHNVAKERRDAYKIYNGIKDLNTELGDQHVAFVFAGNPDQFGAGNLHEHEQLNTRLLTLRFEPMQMDRANLRSDVTERWQKYLSEWETALSVALTDLEPETLSADLGGILWHRTLGSVGALSYLLKEVASVALVDESSRRRLTVTMEAIKSTLMPEKYESAVASLRRASEA